jgi:hypothetical protein
VTETVSCSCTATYGVAAAVRSAGVQVEAHLDHFSRGTQDSEWIEEVTKRGWVIVGKDKGHRYEPLEMLAIERSGARMFTLSSGKRTQVTLRPGAAVLAEDPATFAPTIHWQAMGT